SRHQRDSRTAGQLAASVGHVGGATLLPADDQLDPVASVVERVQHGQVAFPGDAEDLIGALGEQALHEDLAAAARKLRWPSHRWPPFAALYIELVRETTGANLDRVSARPAGSTGSTECSPMNSPRGESGTRRSGRGAHAQRPAAGLLLRLLLLLGFLLVLVVLVESAPSGPECGAFLAADDGATRPSDHRALELAVLLGRSLLCSRALCLGLFCGEGGAGRRGEQKRCAEQRRTDPLSPRHTGHECGSRKGDPASVIIARAPRMPGWTASGLPIDP